MKNTFVLILALFSLNFANAQFSIRPFFGVNNSTLTKDYTDASWQAELGYQAGVDMQIGNKIYFQPGLHWELMNQTLQPTNPALGDLTNFRSSHIRLPMFIGLRLFDASKNDFINIRAFTGPDAAFLIGASGGTFNNVRFNRESLRNASFGYNAGVGIDILIFFVDAGYRWGLTRFFDENLINNGSRANVFYANAGIRFRL